MRFLFCLSEPMTGSPGEYGKSYLTIYNCDNLVLFQVLKIDKMEQ